jgi:hypothetical protein
MARYDTLLIEINFYGKNQGLLMKASCLHPLVVP